MKILHIIAVPAAGGAEILVRDLSIHMAKNGHDMHIGFLNTASDVGRDPIFERDYLRTLSAAGIKYFFIGRQARKNPFWGGYMVRKYVKLNNIDICHSHLIYGLFFGLFSPSVRVYTHHSIRKRVSQTIFRLLSRRVHALVGISKLCGEMLESYANRAVLVIRNAVDQKRLGGTPIVRDFSARTLNLLCVGRVHPHKDYVLLLRSLALLPTDARASIAVRIVGEGPKDYEAELKTLILKLGLEECVEMVGNTNDVGSEMRSAHLFVMSSAWEGLPIALLEALCSGLPVVVTDVGECGELVRQFGCGVVAPRDPERFSSCLSQLLSDRNRLRELSENAQTSASTLAIETAAASHLELYRDLLEATQ